MKKFVRVMSIGLAVVVLNLSVGVVEFYQKAGAYSNNIRRDNNMLEVIADDIIKYTLLNR